MLYCPEVDYYCFYLDDLVGVCGSGCGFPARVCRLPGPVAVVVVVCCFLAVVVY